MVKGSKGLFLSTDHLCYAPAVLFMRGLNCPSKDCMSSAMVTITDVAVELTVWFVEFTSRTRLF